MNHILLKRAVSTAPADRKGAKGILRLRFLFLRNATAYKIARIEAAVKERNASGKPSAYPSTAENLTSPNPSPP